MRWLRARRKGPFVTTIASALCQLAGSQTAICITFVLLPLAITDMNDLAVEHYYQEIKRCRDFT